MNKLFLHIGTHKTGSTALQQGLLFARKTLLKNGFDVIIPYGFAHELGRIVQQTTPNSVPERAKTARTKFKQMLEAAITKRSVIVSSEHFSGVAQESYRDAELRAKTLVEIFRDFPTEVVVYYRRQDTFIESMYNHRIHQGFTESFDEFLAALTPFSFDWFEHASHFISAFGKENVTIRSYESLKKGGGILSDFIEIIGIPSDQAASLIEIAKQAPRQNRGYSPPALELARRANSVLDSEQKQHLRHLLQNVLADTKEVFGKHAHFTSEERRELLYRFEPSNRKLYQKTKIT